MDLDDPEAVALANQHLPVTAAKFGREGNAASHWLYVVTAPIQTMKFQTVSKRMIVELRSTGCQTVFPGSVHPSGERVRWDADGEPATVAADVLVERVRALAHDVADVLGEPMTGDEPKPPKPRANGTHASHSSTGDGVERCIRYLSKCPDAIAGQGGHDATLRAACECIRFGLDDDDAWRALRWFNDNKCEPSWTDRELAHKLDDARTKAVEGERVNGERKTGRKAKRASHSAKGGDSPQLGFAGPQGLTLTATGARKVGGRGKAEARFDVTIGGKAQAPITITTASSSIRDCARDLSNWIEVATGFKPTRTEGVQIQQFIAGTMAKAEALAEHFAERRKAEPREAPSGPTMQSIIIAKAPGLAGLAFLNNDGTAWSETLGRSIDAREFERRVPRELAEACEAAIDFPESRIGLSAPVGTIRQYLLMAWTAAVAALPREVRAETGPDSEAARRYAEAIVRLWTIREKWRKTYARDGADVAMDSATLAQLARERVNAAPFDKSSGWQRVHNSAIDAWYCTTPRLMDGVPTGEPPDAWLGFRFEPVNQLPRHSRPDLPNTRSMNELGIIARRYGLTADGEPNAPVAKVKERERQRRIVVLSRRLTDLILWQWDDGKEPDGDG